MTSFSQVGSHKDRASRTAQQENDLERRMTATSGRKCLEQFERFDRVGLWVRTFAGLLIGMEGWYSTRCGLTWKLSGMKFSRFYFQLVPSTHRTGATEYGLLPTPLASDIKGGDSNTVTLKKGRFVRTSKASGTEFGAKIQHVAKLLPTPAAIDANGPKNLRASTIKGLEKGWEKDMSLTHKAMLGLLPTPRANDSEKRGQISADPRNGLPGQAVNGLLPTPTNSMVTYQDFEQAKYHSSKRPEYGKIMIPTPTASSDAKGGCTRPNEKRQNDTLAHSIHGMVGEPGKTSQLNPRFVLEMMGFPPDWTSLPFLKESGPDNPPKPSEDGEPNP